MSDLERSFSIILVTANHSSTYSRHYLMCPRTFHPIRLLFDVPAASCSSVQLTATTHRFNFKFCAS